MISFPCGMSIDVGIFGFGKSTVAALEYIKQKYQSINLTVRSDKSLSSNDIAQFKPNRILTGEKARSDITEQVLIFSPSVRRDGNEFDVARERGVIFTSDAEIFFNEYKGDVIGVTGSDGKSTTTKLISDMLISGGISATPCGNFGNGFCSYIDTNTLPVAELSSFQLFYLNPKLDTAVITNVTENHLDWHKGFNEYLDTKLKIASDAKRLIYDADNAALTERLSSARAFCVCSLNTHYSTLSEKINAEHYINYYDGFIHLNGRRYIDLRGALRLEWHNIRNYMLATAATLMRVDRQAQEAVIRSFKGLAHRIELVDVIDGIKYINSSIDTTPERCAKTLSSLCGRTVVIICGKSKGASICPLIEALHSYTVGAVLMGEMGYEVLKNISTDTRFSGYPVKLCDNMKDAVLHGTKMLDKPGTLVLSAAATSYDMYSSFEERGKDFICSVDALRIAQDNLNSKNFYAINPSFDKGMKR